jgi:hypothetical protein
MAYLANADRPRFAAFNRTSFTFDHTLHESPAFDLENLVEVSKRLPTSYYSTDAAGVDAGWRDRDVQKMTLTQTMASMADSQSLVLLKGLAEDPDYAPIFRTILAELEEAVGVSLRSDAALWRATIIVGSPHRVTPYHIDGEANFLFQLRGEKTMSVFDPTDRTILTDVELENFYSGDFSAAKYKPERQDDAFSFAFPPGRAVHVPLHAPHWVKNGDNVSVAMSVNCTLHSKAHLAQLYRFNRLMRKSGIAPASPGSSPWQDRIKLAAIGGIGLARRAARPALRARHAGR